jgi:hypothetical protein
MTEIPSSAEQRAKRPRAIQHGRVDVDGVDAIHDAGERGREQPISATQINHDHVGPHAHFDKNRHGIRPQHLPPIGIRHCCCREKADYHAILKGFYFLQASGGIEVGLIREFRSPPACSRYVFVPQSFRLKKLV